jgi:hypothetical protein
MLNFTPLDSQIIDCRTKRLTELSSVVFLIIPNALEYLVVHIAVLCNMALLHCVYAVLTGYFASYSLCDLITYLLKTLCDLITYLLNILFTEGLLLVWLYFQRSHSHLFLSDFI